MSTKRKQLTVENILDECRYLTDKKCSFLVSGNKKGTLACAKGEKIPPNILFGIINNRSHNNVADDQFNYCKGKQGVAVKKNVLKHL